MKKYRSQNINMPAGVHIMNKFESKTLRKIMSQTGLKEIEIRKFRKYRVILSNAQKQGTIRKRSRIQQAIDSVTKIVCQELKLPKEHPNVVLACKAEWENRRMFQYSYIYFNQNPFYIKRKK